MNILFVHSHREWGGGEVSLMQFMDGLSARGHHVTVVCRPSSALHVRLTASAAHVLPIRIGGDFDPITIRHIYHLLKAKSIDVVCVHTEKELRVAGIASVLAGVPLVVSREVDVPIKDSLINRVFYRDVAAGIIVNSFATKNTLLSSAPWLQTQPIRIIWKGIDCSRFRVSVGSPLRDEFGLSEDDVVAGFLGRLDEQKGISTLLGAMAIVARESRKVKLVLAGEGNLRETIERFRMDRKLESQIILAGFREDVPQFLQGIDFLVMPSNWEGFGYAAVEAMAAGKPVIASHVSSLPEIVEDRRSGILVPPRSPERLAEAMIALARSPVMRIGLGKAGETKVQAVFTVSAMMDNLEAMLLETIGKTHSQTRQAHCVSA